MILKKIYRLAYEFRNALNIVVDEKRYGRLTLFQHFPNGCCRYTSDLLAEYLMENGISMEKIKLLESQSNKDGYTHCWLLIDNSLFVDITADQFNGKGAFTKYEPIPCCYVAPCKIPSLYDCFKNVNSLQEVGINFYSGDISFKLRTLYTSVIQQINSNQ